MSRLSSKPFCCGSSAASSCPIIAATALAHGLPLITRNVADFQAIAGLVVINPHDATQLPITGKGQ